MYIPDAFIYEIQLPGYIIQSPQYFPLSSTEIVPLTSAANRIDQEQDQDLLFSPLLFNIILEILTSIIKQEK